VSALPAEQQVEEVAKRLQVFNPEFDGKIAGLDGNKPPTIVGGIRHSCRCPRHIGGDGVGISRHHYTFGSERR